MMTVVGSPYKIDEVYYLQRYAEGWENGKWTERWDIRDCIDHNGYIQVHTHPHCPSVCTDVV